MNENILDPHLVYSDWILTETEFDPEQLNYKETVFTIGNGYLGTRGSFEEGLPGSQAATFINGLYDNVPIYYTELVNCPDWLPLYIIIDNEEFRLDKGEILSYQRQLDLKRGILSRKISWCSPNGKTIDLYFERFASQAEQNVLALRIQLTPIDFDGKIGIRASIDGNPENHEGFNHWLTLDQGYGSASTWLKARTRSSRCQLGMAFKLAISGTKAEYQNIGVPGFPTVKAKFDGIRGETITVDKLVTVFNSRDVETPAQEAWDKLQELPSYEELLKNHQQAWEAIWNCSDIVIEGSTQAQLAIRYNLFQILICAPRNDDRVSIPAKTLSGFGYRGHIFWDTEFFILPFFLFTQPEVARNLLTYRYHTLEGARRKAKYYGFRGAMYAWESAATGDEVTPRWAPPENFYEEDIRIWVRDREVHISADISIAAWYYWLVTGDDEWMRDYGAEIILDTALFWSSRVHLDIQRECYEIRDVIGPDEYHEHDVDNNAFTNRMVQWHLEKALLVYDWLDSHFPEKATELAEKLQVTSKRRWRWKDIAENMFIPYNRETGLIEQFEGFFQLEDVNLDEYEPRTCSMPSLLGLAEVNKRQILKQPDVLMLLYVMGRTAETDYGKEILLKNWDYYAPRTDITYGSSLGPAIHGIVAASLGKTAEAYEFFRLSAFMDLENSRGNTDSGIHAASCGNIWQAVVFGYAGIQFTENGPVAKPNLPPTWKRLQFKLYWRDNWYSFDLKPESNMKTEIKGFIFDLDGVLTDTAESHYQAWQKLADEEGIAFSREANEALRGVSRRDSLLKIIGERKYSEAEIQEMMERKNRYYVESIDEITPYNLLPGAGNLISELREQGIKIALGSASKNARNVIEKLGIADKFDVIGDGNSVQRSKPAPDLFLYAASQLGLEPSECVVVEDAASGIEAALAAGMLTVGIGSQERVGAAKIVLPSLQGVNLKDILSKLGCY